MRGVGGEGMANFFVATIFFIAIRERRPNFGKCREANPRIQGRPSNWLFMDSIIFLNIGKDFRLIFSEKIESIFSLK